MKKYMLIPVLTLLGSIAALLLRLLQIHTGFEPGTGLAIPGNLPASMLLVLLAALTAAFWFLCRKLPEEGAEALAFPDAFSTGNAGLLALPVMGVFLMGLSGLAELAFGILGGAPASALTGDGMTVTVLWTSGPSPRTLLFQGVLSLLSAGALLPAVLACRERPEGGAPRKGLPFHSWMLLVPVVCLVVRLVLEYRTYSIDPNLPSYYTALLSIVLLTLAFYRLSAFAFGAGRNRSFTLCASMAAVLCTAALGDHGQFSGVLLYAGGALTMLGFLLLRLSRISPAEAR